MKLTPYSPPECGIDRLVLFDPAHPFEAAAHHPRRIMIAVTGKIADCDVGIGDRRFDQRFDLFGGHRH